MPAALTRARLVAIAVLVVAVAGAAVWLVAARLGGSTAQQAAAPGVCGGRIGGQPRVYRHVVWVVLENESYDDAVGNRKAPYLSSLVRACGVATRYSAVTHPSLPNYLALTSGGTWGVADDDPPAAHPLARRSLFAQLVDGWHVVAESMPAPCHRSDAGLYAVRHNPATYYVGLRASCKQHDTAGPIRPLARFTLVVPNLCHDGHDCSLATVDRWLERELKPLLADPVYRNGGTAVFVVWDETDDTGSHSNHVAAVVISPYTRTGTRSARAFDHYGLLATTESMLGVPCLAAACTAASMRGAFGL